MRGVSRATRSLIPTVKPPTPRKSDPRERVADAAIHDRAAWWKARSDAGLSSDEERQLRDWLDADPRHRSAVARYESVWKKFDRPFQAGMAEQLAFELEKRARRQRTRSRTVVAAFALVSLLVAGAQTRPGKAWLASLGGTLSASGSAVVLVPERRQLPDGSVAELKPGAVFAVEFTGVLRRVVLSRGEAHFEVKPDSARPFAVVAGGVEARAVGTAFAVELRPEAVEVIVTHGRVEVDRSQAAEPSALAAGPDEKPRVAMLEVGHRIVVDRALPQSHTAPVTALPPGELDERLAWRAPRVEFTSTTLVEAIAVLNAHAAKVASTDERPRRFVFADPKLGKERISGLFRIDRTDAFVKLLKHGFGIEAEPGGRNELVLWRPAAVDAP